MEWQLRRLGQPCAARGGVFRDGNVHVAEQVLVPFFLFAFRRLERPVGCSELNTYAAATRETAFEIEPVPRRARAPAVEWRATLRPAFACERSRRDRQQRQRGMLLIALWRDRIMNRQLCGVDEQPAGVRTQREEVAD